MLLKKPINVVLKTLTEYNIIIINKNTIKKLDNEPRFKKLFDMKFMDLFHYYFNIGQPVNEICCSGIKIPLLEKTKTFHDLLIKYKDLKEDMFQIIKMFYHEDIQEIELNEKSNSSSSNDE